MSSVQNTAADRFLEFVYGDHVEVIHFEKSLIRRIDVTAKIRVTDSFYGSIEIE